MSDTYLGIHTNPISRLTDQIKESAGWANSLAIRGGSRTGLERVDYSGETQPAAEFGRDFFDFLPMPAGGLIAWVGNACGHGAGASILMSGIGAFLRRSAVEKEGHLQKVVGEVNRTVCEVCPDTFYAPLFCCYIDTRRRLLHYVNAGHEPALLVRQRTGRAHRLESTGPVLGLTDRAVYGQRSFPVEAGDVLVAFSEGLSAAIAPARIAEIVRERMGGRSIDLVRDVLSAGGDTVLKEDRTVLAARLIGVLGETVPKAHETALVCAA